MNSNDSDVELSSNKKPSSRGRGRGRGRPPGRPPGRPSKKNKKKVMANNEDTKEETDNENEKTITSNSDISPKLDSSVDSELSHAISFVSPSSKPMHNNEPLNWKYKVNLIGEKVVNPRIHCCEKCQLPILVYGRMIACKHIFCLSCAKQHENVCPRCGEKVLRVEKSGLGTVFMCQTESCKRTYLSQRDLQAHIQHRHVRRVNTSVVLNASNNANIISTTSSLTNVTQSQHSGSTTTASSRTVASYQSPIPVVSSRSNLITIPIQEDNITQISQPSIIVSGQQSYVGPQPPPYSHHMQWPHPPPNANRPPWPWPPMAHPYNNPYNRPYYPQ